MKKWILGLGLGLVMALYPSPAWANRELTPQDIQRGITDLNETNYEWQSSNLLFVRDVTSSTNVGFYIQESTGNVLIGDVGYEPLNGLLNADAVLELSSTTKGFLPPRMNATQRITLDSNLGAADRGMLIFNLSNSQWQGWNGSVWINLAQAQS